MLLEFLLVSSGFTIVLSSLRAGLPNSQELASILCTWLVVILQVVSASMRWSLKRPFAVDLRSARATRRRRGSWSATPRGSRSARR